MLRHQVFNKAEEPPPSWLLSASIADGFSLSDMSGVPIESWMPLLDFLPEHLRHEAEQLLGDGNGKDGAREVHDDKSENRFCGLDRDAGEAHVELILDEDYHAVLGQSAQQASAYGEALASCISASLSIKPERVRVKDLSAGSIKALIAIAAGAPGEAPANECALELVAQASDPASPMRRSVASLTSARLAPEMSQAKDAQHSAVTTLMVEPRASQQSETSDIRYDPCLLCRDTAEQHSSHWRPKLTTHPRCYPLLYPVTPVSEGLSGLPTTSPWELPPSI